MLSQKPEFANLLGYMLLVHRRNIQADLENKETKYGDGTVTVAGPL